MTTEKAKQWLENRLAGGPRHVNVLLPEAMSAGIHESDLRDAKGELGVVSEQNEYGSGARRWSLPFGHGLIEVFERGNDSAWFVDPDMIPTPRIIREFRSGYFAERGEVITYFKVREHWFASKGNVDAKGAPDGSFSIDSIPVRELEEKLDYFLASGEAGGQKAKAARAKEK